MIGYRSTTRLILTILVMVAGSGCQLHVVVPCAGARTAAAPARLGEELTLRINYAGAEAMLQALERNEISDAAVDSLLGVHGVGMTVDNVTRLIPELDRTDFRTAIQRFVRTGRVEDEHAPFNLRMARTESRRVRALLTYIREHEGEVLQRTLAVLALADSAEDLPVSERMLAAVQLQASRASMREAPRLAGAASHPASQPATHNDAARACQLRRTVSRRVAKVALLSARSAHRTSEPL